MIQDKYVTSSTNLLRFASFLIHSLSLIAIVPLFVMQPMCQYRQLLLFPRLYFEFLLHLFSWIAKDGSRQFHEKEKEKEEGSHGDGV